VDARDFLIPPEQRWQQQRNAALGGGYGYDSTPVNVPDRYMLDPVYGQPVTPEQQDMLHPRKSLHGLIQAIAAGLSDTPQSPYASGDAQNAIGGLARGYTSTQLEAVRQRKELEDALRQQKHDQNVADLQATMKARTNPTVAASSLGLPWLSKMGNTPLSPGEALSALKPDKAAVAKPETVDMQMVTANPGLTMADIGKLVTDPSVAPKMAVRPTKPTSPGENRAVAAEERKAAAAERANRNSEGTLLNQTSNRYDTDTAIKSYNEIRGNLTTATEAAKQRNGIGDLALVFAYQRSLEPGNPNVVREGEVTTARKAVGRLEIAKAMPARFFSGDGFTDEGRQRILRFMHEALAARRPLFDTANNQFGMQADAIGVDPNLFVRSFPEDTTTGGLARPVGYKSPSVRMDNSGTPQGGRTGGAARSGWFQKHAPRKP
jgi:hypothetical protein